MRFIFGLSVLLLGTSFAQAEVAGPASSGGGNGYRGRPLESYVQNVEQLPEYKKAVAPALELLEKKLPAFAQDLSAIAQFKNWYFVPVRLPEIPAWKLGVTFRTDQLALQSINAVWLDDVLYQRMNEADRAMLLMHELVMGIKIQNLFARKDCYGTCDLTRFDYEAVRRVTTILLSQQDKFGAEKLAQLLNEYGFGRYQVPTDFSHVHPISVEEFHLLLIAEDRAGKLPNGGGGCGYVFNLNARRDGLSVKIYPARSGNILHDYTPVSIDVSTAPELVKGDSSYSFKYSQPVANPEFGSFRRSFAVHFNKERVTQLKAYWEQYLYDYRDRTHKWVEDKNGPRNSYEPTAMYCR